MGVVKAGATREEVEKRFEVTRGYFRPNEAIYHYRACPLFQIGVKYTPAPGKTGSNDSPGDTVAEVYGP